MGARDGVVGSILGLALGDALGAPFQARRAHDVPSPISALESSWKGLPPGSWTDPSAMARNLWRSLTVSSGILDVDDVLRRHLSWFASRPPHVDTHVAFVLREHERGTPQPAKAVFDRRGPEVSAGNGSVMYCAPLGAAYAHRAGELRAAAPALSALTHWDGRCRTACVAVTLAAAALVRGEEPERGVRHALASVNDLEGGEELEYLVGAAGVERPIDGPDQGFALFTAGVALRTVGEGRGFEEGVRQVVALGGDTDANGAVTGALLGALHGREGLPPTWLARLSDAVAIEREAADLAAVVVGGGSSGLD
jgi:ADP-ribosyl-[dinitrogen reductase] hydrolase